MQNPKPSFWQETLADLQAGIVPEWIVSGFIRLPMILLVLAVCGGVGFSLSWYADVGKQTASEYRAAQGKSNARAMHSGAFQRQEAGMGKVRSKHGAESTAKIKHLVFCRSENGREYFGNFVESECRDLRRGQPVEFEVFNGVITELNANGVHIQAVDHPLAIRSGAQWKTVLFTLMGLGFGVFALKILLQRP